MSDRAQPPVPRLGSGARSMRMQARTPWQNTLPYIACLQSMMPVRSWQLRGDQVGSTSLRLVSRQMSGAK